MLSLLVQSSKRLAAFHLLWFAAFTSQHIQCHLHHPHKTPQLQYLGLLVCAAAAFGRLRCPFQRKALEQMHWSV